MKVWSETRIALNGAEYDIRLLMTDEEAMHLQKVGVIGPLLEIVGMQSTADSVVAGFEKEAHTATGGAIQ